MKKIYLFRHSNPDKTSTLQNEYIPLSQEGKDLAKQLVDKLPVTSPIKVFSSPFIRAKQTADTFSFDVITDARLIERKVRNKNTFTKDLWAKQYTDIDAKNDSGESFRMVQWRMSEFMNDLLMKMLHAIGEIGIPWGFHQNASAYGLENMLVGRVVSAVGVGPAV